MITAVAVCPHPPLLLRELTGIQDVAAPLRARCVDVVRAAVRALGTAGDGTVVVIGGADGTRSWEPGLPGGVERFGPRGQDGPGPSDRTPGRHAAGPALPLSLAVGARLLDEAGWAGEVRLVSVDHQASPAECDRLGAEVAGLHGPVALLVLGDGSARRGEKAPGHLDERSFAFDDAVAEALASGDAGALRALDPALAEQLLVAGRAAWAVAAAAVLGQGDRPVVETAHREDPFGVGYFVALWRLGGR